MRRSRLSSCVRSWGLAQFGTSGDAGVLGQQLVQPRQAAGQGGEIDRELAESLADAINELFDGLGCSTPPGANVIPLRVTCAPSRIRGRAGDEPSHAVADEHDLRVGPLTPLGLPAAQGRFDLLGEVATVEPVDSRQS